MANKLDAFCDMCKSWTWCGRPCANAPMANTDVANGDEVANSEPDMANAEEAVSSTYLYRDPEHRRAYMREYMKRRRSGS